MHLVTRGLAEHRIGLWYAQRCRRSYRVWLLVEDHDLRLGGGDRRGHSWPRRRGGHPSLPCAKM